MSFPRLMRYVVLPILGLLSFQSLHSQPVVSKVPFSYADKEYWFDQATGMQNSGLLNGREYSIAFVGATSHPFFGSRELTQEQVVFRSRLYTRVPLLYDIYADALILRYRDSRGMFSMVELDKAHVERFTLYGHNFRRMMRPNSAEPHLADGYFDVLFDGDRVKLVAKYMKTSFANSGLRDYRMELRYFAIYRDHWTQVRGNSSFSDLIPSEKKRISAFIKAQKYKVSKKEEKEMIAIAKYCDNLGK